MATSTIAELAAAVTGGVDTHLDVNVAAALDQRGVLLGIASFPTTSQGHRQLEAWLVSTAPDELRSQLRALPPHKLVAVCAAARPGDAADPAQATKVSLRSIARRYQHLDREITELDAQLEPLVRQASPPSLLARSGVGTDIAGQLLVTAGDNPDRLRSPAAFAHLCGVAPIPIASGRSSAYRLNRGGDRAANSALYRIVLCRLRWDPDTRAYLDRKIKEGKTKKAAIRCLKHYIAREIYNDLRQLTP